MSDQPDSQSVPTSRPAAPVEEEQLGSIAKLLWAGIDFFVFMGMSVESRDDGRQLVLKYFGPPSAAAKRRWQRFREWCVWLLVGVPVGGVLGGWLLTKNASLFQEMTGLEAIELGRSMELCAHAVAFCLIIWLPFVLKGSSAEA